MIGQYRFKRSVTKRLLISGIPALIILAVTATFAGMYSLVCMGVVWTAGYLTLSLRSRGGMDESLAKAMLAKYRDKPGVVFIAGVPVDPETSQVAVLAHASTSLPHPNVAARHYGFYRKAVL